MNRSQQFMFITKLTRALPKRTLAQVWNSSTRFSSPISSFHVHIPGNTIWSSLRSQTDHNTSVFVRYDNGFMDVGIEDFLDVLEWIN